MTLPGLKIVIVMSMVVQLFWIPGFSQDSLLESDSPLTINRNILEDKTIFYEHINLKTLSGKTQSNDTLQGSYILFGTYTIAEYDTIIIAPGTWIYGEHNAIFSVRGVLLVKGKSLERVVFTSLPKVKHYLPPKTDIPLWQGMTVYSQAYLDLGNSLITDCQEGITTTKECRYLKLSCVTFRNTGNYHIWSNNTPLIFENSQCVNHTIKKQPEKPTQENKQPENKQPEIASTSKTPASTPAIDPLPNKRNRAKRFTLSVCGTLTAGCLIAGAVMHKRAWDLDKKAEVWSPAAQSYWDQRNRNVGYRNILLSTAGGGFALSLLFLFTLPSKQGK